MIKYELLLLLSLSIKSFAFIEDSLSNLFIPFITVQDLPKGSQLKREITVFDNEYIPSGQYQIGCFDDSSITLHDVTNDNFLTGTKRFDYEVICSGSACIASKHDTLIEIPDITAIQNATSFDVIIQSGYSVIFSGQLTEQDIDDNAVIKTIYDSLKSITSTLVLSSAKLASGGDYGDDNCLHSFHLWAMYSTKPFVSEISDPVFQQFIDDASCIVQSIESGTNKTRPIDLQDALEKCSDTSTTRDISSENDYSASRRRLQAPSFLRAHIETFLQADILCPLRSETLNACGNPKFGMCGSGEYCWVWICVPQKWNDWNFCGCNNGCFLHDYGCSCKGTLSWECINTFGIYAVDQTCHAGSFCVTVNRVENVASIVYGADVNIFGAYYGDMYVEIEPYEPRVGNARASSKKTKTLRNFRGNWYRFNQRICFTMRVEKFIISIKDEDVGFDDLLWGRLVTTPPNGQWTVGSGTGSEPKIVFETFRYGGW